MQTPPAVQFLAESDGMALSAREHAAQARDTVRIAREAIARSRALVARLDYKGESPDWRRSEYVRFIDALLGP